MASESQFVVRVKELSDAICPKHYSIEKGKPLLYRLALDNELKLIDPDKVKEPPRGGTGKSYAAFETDLCVLKDMKFPRIVMEFKTSITTHDILIYSAKAKKHKMIYPSLRYGLIIERDNIIPPRFFTHNESLDFCVAIGEDRHNEQSLVQKFKDLIEKELAESNFLEAISNGKLSVSSYSLHANTNPISIRSRQA